MSETSSETGKEPKSSIKRDPVLDQIFGKLSGLDSDEVEEVPPGMSAGEARKINESLRKKQELSQDQNSEKTIADTLHKIVQKNAAKPQPSSTGK